MMILFILGLISCSSEKQSKNITVFSAASLTEVMTALVDSFEQESKINVSLNFASSGTLARQIEMGAGADIFLSANKQWVDFLVNKKVVGSENCVEVAGNSLVLISGVGKMFTLSEALESRFVIGDPASVPVGTYAKMALEKIGLWKDGHDFLYGRDVKHVLKLVEMGEADAGIVYKTDAYRNGKVQVLQEIPDSVYPAIKYFICDLKSDTSSKTPDLIQYVKSAKGREILEEFGFKSLQ